MHLFYIYLIIILFIIVILLLTNNNIEQYEKYTNKISKKDLENKLLNIKNNIYNVSLSKNIKIQRKNCFQKCNYQDCVNFYHATQNYNKCIECQKNKNKCFKDLDTYGACDNCTKDLNKNNCKNINKYGCTNPYNIFSNKGIQPYFIEVPSNNNNSPFDSKCVFCWNLKSYI